MDREHLENVIKFTRLMSHHVKPGDPTRCNCSVRVGGGPNSRRAVYRKCARPVFVVDVDDQGWCSIHATPDNTVVCDRCHMTAKQGCICEALQEHGLTSAYEEACRGR